MADLTFTTPEGQTIDRELLIAYLNTGTKESPVWSAIGKRVEDTSEEKPVYDPEAPNPNPVEAGPAVAPKDENGKFDATKIADASDFGDWEEQGCKG